jgi:RimJ/RimL family protein N-acetyltransferase
MTALQLRRATKDDARQLWVWANDGAVRAQAFTARPISWGEHIEWLERTLGATGSRLWIAERDREPVGQFRVDSAGDRARISYSIAKDHRGRGLAPLLLQLGVERACVELAIAVVEGVVKESNVASWRAFERARFTLAAQSDEQGHRCRRYEWRCRPATEASAS